ncbi:hypothetical protein SDC9_164550 [bioreactor metagenome]|uniref:Uncharacterized protein n=1 Tax=bioreactor metagenome TaxID=1076179 RepID=A0A645FTF5_9ZZZZ
MKLQLRHRATQRRTGLAQAFRLGHPVVAEQAIGLAETLQQVVSGVAQQTLQTMEIVHHHQQRILQLGDRHHRHRHRRVARTRPCRLHCFSICMEQRRDHVPHHYPRIDLAGNRLAAVPRAFQNVSTMIPGSRYRRPLSTLDCQCIHDHAPKSPLSICNDV